MSSSTYSAVTVQNQIIYNTPWMQRVYSSNPPSLEEEIENKITQQVSDEDYVRVPSGNAVHDFVVNFTTSHFGSIVIDEIISGEHNKSPSADAVYNALLNKAALESSNIFNGENTFSQLIISPVEVDLFDENNNNKLPNVLSIRNFVTEVLSDETVKYVFNNPSLEWLVEHNRDTDLFHCSIRDINNETVHAPIEIIDDNKFKVLFTESTSGSVVVKF